VPAGAWLLLGRHVYNSRHFLTCCACPAGVPYDTGTQLTDTWWEAMWEAGWGSFACFICFACCVFQYRYILYMVATSAVDMSSWWPTLQSAALLNLLVRHRE
jgi:ABC-type multidrug transport system permease subunit